MKKSYSSHGSKQPANAKQSKVGASNGIAQNDSKAGQNKTSMTLKK